jgi:Calcineurin-like phosphoesterase
MSQNIKTSFLIMSDSHGYQPLSGSLSQHIDVAIHCGDLTQESKIDEFQKTLRYLEEIEADLKLVIAGNNDFTMDVAAFEKMVTNARPPLEPELVRKEYGDYGEIRKILAENAGIIFLDEGSYEFSLRNGALLRLYASPFTPSLSGDMGFQYHPSEGHRFEIPNSTDIVITHGPPEGIFDRTENGRAGCPYLFEAVARAKPRLHCFGHIHEGWGGRLVTWRRKMPLIPSHLNYIDNDKSTVLSNTKLLDNARETSDLTYQPADCDFDGSDSQTLFVNAALHGVSDITQIPWIANIPLPRA